MAKLKYGEETVSVTIRMPKSLAESLGRPLGPAIVKRLMNVEGNGPMSPSLALATADPSTNVPLIKGRTQQGNNGAMVPGESPMDADVVSVHETAPIPCQHTHWFATASGVRICSDCKRVL